jgi:hypothetical protein
MRISGPFLDPRRKNTAPGRRKATKSWYLVYFATVAGKNGRARRKRFRPYYASRDAAVADKPRITAQYGAAGIGARGVLSRTELEDYEQARALAPEATQVEQAKFWRLHHPRDVTKQVKEYVPDFLADVEVRLGKTAHYRDLKTRLRIFCRTFGDRLPATITRDEGLTYFKSLKLKGRTILNHKRAACNLFNFILSKGGIPANPFGGMKRRELPRVERNEIRFLTLDEFDRYLRALERYDPELVAHEIIQLIAGVRADDEMANFRGEWVKTETKQIVIPAAIAKTTERAVIDGIEENFWAWWKEYGRTGLLRPRNYQKRWYRVRILAEIKDQDRADELAQLPVKTIIKLPERSGLKAWKWNARRRTFCTYHVAKHESADKTALILRQIGGAATLHKSYRGLGVTKAQGVAYFERQPKRQTPVLPIGRKARGIVRLQLERRVAGELSHARSA